MESHSALLFYATLDTLIMVFLSGFFSFLLGIPLGVLLFVTNRNKLLENKALYYVLDAITNIGRSIPFIILMVAIIPFTHFILGTSIGTLAAVIPLTVSAIPFVARLTSGALAEVPDNLVEMARAMGATSLQIIWKVLLAEAKPALIHGSTITMVTLVSYTAMAGTIGGGGLGSVAINYGYQRFNYEIMLATVIILIVIVQFMQFIGDKLTKYVSH